MCRDFPDFTIKNCDLTMGFHSTDWFVGENLQETIGFSHEDHGVFLQIFPQTNPLMDGRMGGCGVLRVFFGKSGHMAVLVGMRRPDLGGVFGGFRRKAEIWQSLGLKKRHFGEENMMCAYVFTTKHRDWLEFMAGFPAIFGRVRAPRTVGNG